MLSRRRIRLNGSREVDDPSVRYELKNQKPVDLLDLTSSLAAFGESYQDFVTDAGFDLEPGNVRFFVKDIRSGSIIADLASQAAQGSLTLQHVEAAAAFMANLNDIIQFFLGIGAPSSPREKPSKREADQVIKILEPVAKDGGSQLFLTVSNGDIHLHQHHYDSQQANAAQNSARRYLGPPIPPLKSGMMFCFDCIRYGAAFRQRSETWGSLRKYRGPQSNLASRVKKQSARFSNNRFPSKAFLLSMWK